MKPTRTAAGDVALSALNNPADADAVRALAWLERGEPQVEIIYDDAVPKQTKENLANFRKASLRRKATGKKPA